MTKQMKAVIVPDAKAAWEVRERAVPEPGPGEVLVRVHACGICGTDLWMAHGVLSFREFPLLMGHEGVGEVVALGAGVTERKVGDRVGLPMMQKRCGACDFCREEHPNSFVTAGNCASPTLTGVNVDGALAEYAVADIGGTVLLPDGITYEDAAPTMCAGYTTWAGIRRADARPGARVAVVGVGGIGHLAIQFAKAAGYHVIAVTASLSKHALARELGADDVVADGAALKEIGGADVLLHTSSSHAAAVDAMAGLRPWGKLVLMGLAEDEMILPALPLTTHSYQVIGSAHNGLEYLAEALDIVARGHVKPMVELFPLERVNDAYQRAAAGEMRFKAVVTF
ncbi:alcohol dehydrogenase catalytic domain-containing protein [Nonomuraea sp. NPDC049421]|uniref:alcohol dehydrogenase catalytic domain-containing protein n=1 Tax=Nonomuraea sp. NPDC049421 TaxID=3155275 RepID=UPI0034499D8D